MTHQNTKIFDPKIMCALRNVILVLTKNDGQVSFNCFSYYDTFIHNTYRKNYSLKFSSSK